MRSHFYLAHNLPADSPDAQIRANIPKSLFWMGFTGGVTVFIGRFIYCTFFSRLDGLKNRKDQKLDHYFRISDRNYENFDNI